MVSGCKLVWIYGGRRLVDCFRHGMKVKSSTILLVSHPRLRATTTPSKGLAIITLIVTDEWGRAVREDILKHPYVILPFKCPCGSYHAYSECKTQAQDNAITKSLTEWWMSCCRHSGPTKSRIRALDTIKTWPREAQCFLILNVAAGEIIRDDHRSNPGSPRGKGFQNERLRL